MMLVLALIRDTGAVEETWVKNDENKTKTLSMTEFDKIWFKLQEDNNIDFDED